MYIFFGLVLLFLYFNLLHRVNKLEEIQNSIKVPPVRTNEQIIDSTAELYNVDKSSLQNMLSENVGPISATGTQISSMLPSEPALQNYTNQHQDKTRDAFSEWLQTDTLMKIGAFFLLIALGWFVSYAFMNNWIGPVGRITLGLLVGLGILVLGTIRIQTREHQGAVFLVLGSSIILLTIVAAQTVYQMFNPYLALIIVLMSVVYVAFVSVLFRRNSLAIASLIIAAIAPIFVSGGMFSAAEHYVYLLVIVLGTLWVVYITAWRNLTLIALIITIIQTLPLSVTQQKEIALLWAFIFTMVFFIANIVSLIRQSGMKLTPVHGFTAVGTALYIAYWILAVAPAELQSLLLIAWALVFSSGSFIAYKSTGAQEPFYVYALASLGLIGIATAAEFEGAALTIAFTLEITALLVAVALLRLGNSVVATVSMLYVIPVILSLVHITSHTWRIGVLHQDFFVLSLLTIVFIVVGMIINETSEKNNQQTKMTAGKTLIVLGSLYAMVTFWLSVHALLEQDIAIVVVLVVYSVIGVALYMIGHNVGNRNFIVSGATILGFVILRVLFVDVWQMPLPGRIITFMVIGVLLISTAFIAKKDTTHTN